MFTDFPRFKDFVTKFNLTDLQKWASAPKILNFRGSDYCKFSKTAPTVGMMTDAYGATITAGWIGNHINHFLGMFGVPPEKKPTVDMLRTAGRAWLTAWPQLKATEIWVLFYDILAGKYGQVVFGWIELSTLGAYLSKHMETRLAQQSRIDQHERSERAKAELHAFEKEKKRVYRLYQSEDFKKLPSERQNSLKKFLKIYYDIE